MTRTISRRCRILLAFLLIAVAGVPRASAQDQPHVHLIATGGTISARVDDRLTAEDLVRSVPDVDRYARVTFEQFANVASTALTLDQWLQLSRRINALFTDDRALAGIVVTSGTDTLEETAFFLHLTVRDPRPVVLVGAMRSASTIGYEGVANLLQAVRVAAEPRARDKGVLVVLNDEINSARDATKTDAVRLHTFRSRDHGLLGVVDADRVVFFRQILQRHTHRSEFDVKGVSALPRVDVLLVYQDAPGDLIRAAVDAGARGLVIAGAGLGSVSVDQNRALDYASGRGVVTVVGTRSAGGRIAQLPSLPPAVQLTDSQRTRWRLTIGAEDHLPVKARILLMLALTKTADPAEIQRIFTEY